jgi:diaminopimelate decarboxylase
VGGCDTVELAGDFGTPLYIFDEETLRSQCRAFIGAFRARYPDTAVAYAAKAYLGRALAAIVAQEGMDLDVVSGGELAIAASVNFPADRIHFHGNNKSEVELREALDYGIARVVVDNFHEMQLLNGLAQARGIRQKVLLRLSPGIDPHTHHKTTTGTLDNKFGIPMFAPVILSSTPPAPQDEASSRRDQEAGGAGTTAERSEPTVGITQAEAAVRQAMDMPGLELVGLHVHLGSPIFELQPYTRAVDIICDFAAKMQDKLGMLLREFSPGGGFAVAYTDDQHPPSPDEYAEAIIPPLKTACERYGLPLPRLIIEPGRSIVARAGVALYTVGSSKDVPDVRRYVSVDGGMADNIRPAMYDSKYSAVVANRVLDERVERVTIAGKYCESGDVLMKDADLPPLVPGDILAMPAAGAYAIAMASNYNASLRPAIVLVKDGRPHLIRRREIYEDLMRPDVWPVE